MNYVIKHTPDQSLNRVMDHFWEPSLLGSLFGREDFFNTLLGDIRTVDSQRIHQQEDENEKKLFLEVPGFDKKDIKVSYENQRLMIEGRVNEKEKEHFQKEDFRNVVKVGDINPKDLTVSLNKGILEISITKKETEKKIDIPISGGPCE